MSPAILPASRPELTKEAVCALLRDAGVSTDVPALIGRRGYFRDTMGTRGVNDIGLYDDAMFYLSPSAFCAFNANTDHSKQHANVALLQCGVWRYKKGIHNVSKEASRQYTALVQAGAVRVSRFGTESVRAGVDDARGRCLGNGIWEGWFGINIHRGGFNTTSSEGCQTIHPDQWEEFISLVLSNMSRYSPLSIPYLLTEREDA